MRMQLNIALLLCIGLIGITIGHPDPQFGLFSNLFGGGEEPELTTVKADISEDLKDTVVPDAKSNKLNVEELADEKPKETQSKDGIKGLSKIRFVPKDGKIENPKFTDDSQQIVTPTMKKELNILFGKLLNTAFKMVAEFSNLVGGDGQEILTQLKNSVGSTISVMGALVNGESINQIIQNVRGTFDKLFKISKEIQLLIESQSDKPLGELMKTLSNSVSEIFGHIGSIIAGDQGKEVMSDIGKHIGNIISEISLIIGGESARKIVIILKTIMQNMGDALGEIGTAVTSSDPEYDGTERIGNALGTIGLLFGNENDQKLMMNIGRMIGTIIHNIRSIVLGKAGEKFRSALYNIGGHLGNVAVDLMSFTTRVSSEDITFLITNGGLAAVSEYGHLVTGVVDEIVG